MPLRIFPVASVPGVHYGDDWGQPRTGERTHKGTDIFGPEGTPVLAPDDGTLQFAVDPIGGRAFYLRAPDGVTYYGAHLSAFGPQKSLFGPASVDVRAGDVVGYVGHYGNAAGTPDHLHLEVHPGGGAAVDPYPLLRAAEVRAAPPRSSPTWAWLLSIGAVGAGAYFVHRMHRTGRTRQVSSGSRRFMVR